jgi:FkbM family methyltransferase
MHYQLMVELASDRTPSEECLILNGVVIPDDPAIITPLIRAAIADGRFEATEANQIRAIVRPGDRVLEIGAGIGYISTLLSRERRVARVIAVEANPALIGFMTRLHAANRVRKVRRINAVLTNEPVETATFYQRRDFWMGSLAAGPNPYVATAEVPTLNLDRLLRDEGISLVVCDIEGAESGLFDGADLSGVDRVYLETHDHVTGLSGVRRLFATMSEHGFVYDPRHSRGSVVLFQRLGDQDIRRPYAG